MQETRVQSLGWEDSLEEEVATHSSSLAWRFPWTEEPGGLLCKESGRTLWVGEYAHPHAPTRTHTQKIAGVLLFVFPLTLVLDPNITTQSLQTALPLN